jgi:hypothetical protein
MKTAEEHMKTSRLWSNLWQLVQVLGEDGQSSDESEDGDSRSRIVHCQEWRSAAVTKLLELIDTHRAKLNANGHRRAGNVPGLRLRSSDAPVSARDPPCGLPIDCYDEDWYKSLNEWQKKLLDAQPPHEIPEGDDVFAESSDYEGDAEGESENAFDKGAKDVDMSGVEDI